jgi:hypothetical protein
MKIDSKHISNAMTTDTELSAALAIINALVAPTQVGLSNSAGTSTAHARADHVHAHGSQTNESLHSIASSIAHGFMASTDKSKLDGVAAGATANSSDATLLNRANHTGTQAPTTIVEDATHRFTTDTEKTLWNGKYDASNPTGYQTAAEVASAISGKANLTGGNTFSGNQTIDTTGASSQLIIDANASTTFPALITFANSGGTGDFRIWGDGGDIFWQGGGGRNLQMGTYHGMDLMGGRQTTTLPAFLAGTGAVFNTRILNTSDSINLILKGITAQTANFFEARDDSENIKLKINNAGQITMAEAATPAVPTTGATLFIRNNANRQMYAQMGKSGVNYSFQPFVARNKTTLWQANGNATTSTVIGQAFATAGTATTRSVSSASFFGSFRRLGYVTAGTAGSSAGIRVTAAQYFRGSVPRIGGFHFIARFGVSDAATVATSRLFVGLTSTTTVIGNVQPSTLLNIIGIGADSGDANLQIMHNDGVGSATKIDLGASFPSKTLSTNMYEISIFCAPNGTTVYYEVSDLTSDIKVTGSLSTDLPAATQLLAYQLWRSNGTTALAAGLDIVSVYMETDY